MRTRNEKRAGVLFIHEAASRNGAPIVLLHLLRSLRANVDRPLVLLLNQGGALESEFAEIIETTVAERSAWCPGGVRSRLMRSVGCGSLANLAERADLRRALESCEPAVVYMNGFAASNFRLVELLNLEVPLITHVHEIGLLFRAQAGSALARMISETAQFVACSNAVKENLVVQHAVDPLLVEVVHESVPVAGIAARRSRDQILRELGFPPDAQLVVGCGNAAWNKGTDVFVQTARRVCRECSRSHFVWVGQRPDSEALRLDQDVRLMGLSGKVCFTGAVSQPADYISAADVFVLSSREDSFPLVCLEAAALGKPIVCFANAGGMPEFVEEDAGFVVPYLDVESMAVRVAALLQSPGCRLRLGRNAACKVRQRHNVDDAAPRIAEIIERTIAGESRLIRDV